MLKLYRVEPQGKAAGICAGLGEIFNIDATIIRLAMVFLCVITGFWPLIAAYIAGWFIIPLKDDLENSGSL